MNKYDYIIRLENEKDYREVENLAREAFWNLSVPGCTEHYFIHMMRDHEDFIPELDYVLEMDGKIVGCVMYCKGKLVDEQGNTKEILTMGPLCVLPEYQRKGFGKALLEHTFALAEKMGYDTVINFGNPDNYVARGYKSCKKYNVCFEGDIFPAALLVKVLKEDALDGRKWFYHQCDADKCCEDEEAVERFDAEFPPKEKAWQPSQEEFYIHSHSAITW
ncbi:GNAT family N-acetyltransferase [Ruminococcus sp. XPD3002]|uniref:GNAT family N-acetyltransferase n=1 Tax=Ruminococcus sp. XPD3002 TaxID=1452269 RepID=UPI000915E4A2|nr:Predicted N-acetyltransferase YhbS [Ruminococcus flavefaciens]